MSREKSVILKFVSLVLLSLMMAGVFAVKGQAGDKSFKVVFLGDSITAGYGLPPGVGFVDQMTDELKSAMPEVSVVNAGVSGDTSAGGLARLDWSLPEDVDAVVIELGANDALRGLPPKATLENLTQIIEKLKARGVAVMLAGMVAPPNMGEAYEAEFNAIYPKLAEQYSLMLDRFVLEGVAANPELNQSDGIHPNEKGSKIIADRFLPLLKSFIAASKANSTN